jgi:hypothetical protein
MKEMVQKEYYDKILLLREESIKMRFKASQD